MIPVFISRAWIMSCADEQCPIQNSEEWSFALIHRSRSILPYSNWPGLQIQEGWAQSSWCSSVWAFSPRASSIFDVIFLCCKTPHLLKIIWTTPCHFIKLFTYLAHRLIINLTLKNKRHHEHVCTAYGGDLNILFHWQRRAWSQTETFMSRNRTARLMCPWIPLIR